MGKQVDLESSLLPVILPPLEVAKPEVYALSLNLPHIFTRVFSFWSVSSAEPTATQSPKTQGSVVVCLFLCREGQPTPSKLNEFEAFKLAIRTRHNPWKRGQTSLIPREIHARRHQKNTLGNG
jgi:hypothetical protein